MSVLQSLSFRKKILFSTLLIMFLVSVGMALATRWVLVTNMTSELELRGIAIAQSLAELSRTYILTKDKPNLVSLVFDAAQLGERKPLIAYIFILDIQQNILAHTFTTPFPPELRYINSIAPEQNNSVQLTSVGGKPAYDIAVPVREGIYQIGTVHVGLNKKHIDQLIGKLRMTFLGIMLAIMVIVLLIIHWLSRYISRPISELTKMADEVSRGNFDIPLHFGRKPENAPGTRPEPYPDREGTAHPPPVIDELIEAGFKERERTRPGMDEGPRQKRIGDEVAQLADSFNNMVQNIKLYRSRLRESEEKYRSLFNSGPDPIFVLDRDTIEILDANPSAEQTFGYSKEELLGRPFVDLLPEYREAVASHFQEVESAGLDNCVMSQRVRAYRKGNVSLRVNIHACSTVYRQKEAVIVSANDITHILEKDAQLIQAGKMSALGEMSAGVAHELNQPLNAIKMGSEFLKMMIERGESIPQNDLYEVANEVSSQVDRASEIINSLREFGRKAEFIEERVNLNKPVRAVFALLGQQLSLQNIEVKLDLDESLPPILAHNNRLQQVIFNLVTNARDAINRKPIPDRQPDSRVITIRSFRQMDRAVVSVADTGTGISPSVKEKMFEPFFTTKETGQGMGLGLSITYGIIQDYGGKIEARTEEGMGTTFELSFPACAEDKEGAQA